MASYTLGYDEKYKCFYCNDFINSVETLKASSWKCPKCGEHVYIAAPHLASGHTLIRKSAAELEENDLVHLPGSQDIYSVITTSITDKGKIRVALKNYGSPTFNATDFVSVVEGGYYEDTWKENPDETARK